MFLFQKWETQGQLSPSNNNSNKPRMCFLALELPGLFIALAFNSREKELLVTYGLVELLFFLLQSLLPLLTKLVLFPWNKGVADVSVFSSPTEHPLSGSLLFPGRFLLPQTQRPQVLGFSTTSISLWEWCWCWAWVTQEIPDITSSKDLHAFLIPCMMPHSHLWLQFFGIWHFWLWHLVISAALVLLLSLK